jgi:imidazolonepropionase-like amidohydrolase
MAARLGAASIAQLGGIAAAAGQGARIADAYAHAPLAGLAASAEGWLDADALALEQAAADLAASGVTLVPLVSAMEVLARLDDPALTARPDLADVADTVRQGWNRDWIGLLGWNAAMLADLRLTRARHDRALRHLVAAGGRLAVGSGAGMPYLVPGSGVHFEMELLVAAGLSPLEALAAATVRGADVLRDDTIGRLRTGALADLVVLTGDPLRDIRNTRRIARVMLGGEWVR